MSAERPFKQVAANYRFEPKADVFQSGLSSELSSVLRLELVPE